MNATAEEGRDGNLSTEGLLFGEVGTENGDNTGDSISVENNGANTDTGGTVMFGPHSGNDDYSYDNESVNDSNIDIPEDLNKASDYVLNKAKAKMDVKFEENRVRPGDEGYVWDKQIDFDPPNEVSEWDDD